MPALPAPPSLLASGTPQPPASLESLRFSDRILLSYVSEDSGEVHMVMELPDTSELIELSSNDDKP